MVEPLAVEAEARRELPQKRSKLLFQPQHPGCEEIGKWGFDLAQLFQMGDETAALDREEKIIGRLVIPAGEEFGPLQRIMRAVDLDRIEMPAGIGEFVALAQLLGVEAAAPAGITPAGDADPDPAGIGCGAAAHRIAWPRHGKIAAC